MWHLYGDAHEDKLWQSIVSILVNNPSVVDALPKFKDTRGNKTTTFLGQPTEEAPISPLHNLLFDLIPVLRALKEGDALITPPSADSFSQWPNPAPENVVVYATLNDEKARRRPRTTNFQRSSRIVRIPDVSLLAAKTPCQR